MGTKRLGVRPPDLPLLDVVDTRSERWKAAEKRYAANPNDDDRRIVAEEQEMWDAANTEFRPGPEDYMVENRSPPSVRVERSDDAQGNGWHRAIFSVGVQSFVLAYGEDEERPHVELIARMFAKALARAGLPLEHHGFQHRGFPSLEAEVVHLRRQRDDLQVAGTALLERARRAEAELLAAKSERDAAERGWESLLRERDAALRLSGYGTLDICTAVKTLTAREEQATTREEQAFAAIRKHRDQRGDDRCWLDDLDLYRALPEGGCIPSVLALPPRDAFLANCARFHASRQEPGTEPAGGPCGRWFTREEVAEVDRSKAELHARGLTAEGVALREQRETHAGLAQDVWKRAEATEARNDTHKARLRGESMAAQEIEQLILRGSFVRDDGGVEVGPEPVQRLVVARPGESPAETVPPTPEPQRQLYDEARVAFARLARARERLQEKLAMVPGLRPVALRAMLQEFLADLAPEGEASAGVGPEDVLVAKTKQGPGSVEVRVRATAGTAELLQRVLSELLPEAWAVTVVPC